MSTYDTPPGLVPALDYPCPECGQYGKAAWVEHPPGRMLHVCPTPEALASARVEVKVWTVEPRT